MLGTGVAENFGHRLDTSRALAQQLPDREGLAESGFDRLAKRLRGDTAGLIAEHGFFEYFDPLDGRGCGGDRFSWTAAMWLAWAGPHAA